MCYRIRPNRNYQYRHDDNGASTAPYIWFLIFLSLSLPMLDLALSRASVAEMR